MTLMMLDVNKAPTLKTKYIWHFCCDLIYIDCARKRQKKSLTYLMNEKKETEDNGINNDVNNLYSLDVISDKELSVNGILLMCKILLIKRYLIIKAVVQTLNRLSLENLINIWFWLKVCSTKIESNG